MAFEKPPIVMTNQEVHDTIVQLLESVNREGMQDLINYLEVSGFFVDPASARFHLSVKGGLARHSLIVYQQLVSLFDIHREYIAKVHKMEFSEDSLILVSLLHDLCKIQTYEEKIRWFKENGSPEWKNEKGYQKIYGNKELPAQGHGSGSVIRALKYIRLDDYEIEAILHHMGSTDQIPNTESGSAVLNSYSRNPLASLTHLADMTATWITEAPITNDMIEGLELI